MTEKLPEAPTTTPVVVSEPAPTPTPSKPRPVKAAKKAAAKRAATAAGLHDATAREVKVGDYPERSYSDAMTSEQRQALKDADLI